jgi:hypothetical protein
MMLVYLQITLHPNAQIHARVLTDLLKHVVEKAQSGRNFTGTITIQVESYPNIL